VPPDPKPRKRVRARTPAERERAYALPYGTRCLLGGMHAFSWRVERAHIVPRSQGGDDVRENIAPLCETCHHTLDQSAGERHAIVAAAVRSYIDAEPDVLAYVLERKGQAWLDRRYPTR
jgi:hypothetical protein